MRRLVLSGTGLAMLMTSSPVFAQRAETSTPAIVAVSDRCALTPVAQVPEIDSGTPEFFGAVIGTILAAVAGELVQTGVNAAGEALEAASREQGFVAEGTTTFLAGQINYSAETLKNADGSVRLTLPPKAAFTPGRKCLHLFVQGSTGTVDRIFSDSSLIGSGREGIFDWAGDDKVASDQRKIARAELVALGVNSVPDLYAEVVLLPGKEGFIAKPLLIWYRQQLKGAPKGASAAEMHLLFSTPAFDAEKPGIGTGFAGARIGLPKVAPNTVLTWEDLKGYSSVTLPPRPTDGFIDTNVTAFNEAVVGVSTAKEDLRKAESALAAAQRLVDRDPKPEAQEALILARESVDEARLTLVIAETAIAGRKAKPAGATNAQARVVIIRSANKFGLALAKALKGQAEAAGKAATDALAPRPAWTVEDTVYLTAIQEVEGKQKAYDTALAGGDAAAILAASQELRLAKAKANEAAVTSKRRIPYPGLLK